MLGGAVEVGGDGAGADVGLRADRGVTKIAEMAGLHTIGQLGVLQLAEVADVNP
jgi:hypothetical protein